MVLGKNHRATDGFFAVAFKSKLPYPPFKTYLHKLKLAPIPSLFLLFNRPNRKSTPISLYNEKARIGSLSTIWIKNLGRKVKIFIRVFIKII